MSDQHHISLYDLSRALYGFERCLALTTHLVLNDEVITQATALKGADILAKPPEEGSFSIMAVVGLTAAGLYKLGTLKKDNPLGHLVYSTYDYLVHSVTGQPVDYDKSIREIYEKGKIEETLGLKMPGKNRLNSLAEKIEPPLTSMHRPFLKSGTAEKASVRLLSAAPKQDEEIKLNHNTFAGMKYRSRLDQIEKIKAKISVFNPNTFNGRLFVDEQERTIPFYLTPAGRSPSAFKLIGESYSKNLNDRTDTSAFLEFDVLPTKSKLGRTTKYSVVKVGPTTDFDVIDNHDLLIEDR